MLRISQEEYRRRLERLEIAVAEADLEVFLVTSFDSIYYLTGKGFEPITSNAGNESRFGTKLADSECHRIRQTLSDFITPGCQRVRKDKKWV